MTTLLSPAAVERYRGDGLSGPDVVTGIGFAIRYIPTYVKQLAGAVDGAMLVRGVDDYHHFVPEHTPASDLAPTARAHHAEAVARSAKILYRGAGVERFR